MLKLVKEIQDLHKRVQDQIEKANERYQNQANKNRKPAIFKPSDLVQVHLRKEFFASKRKSKLLPRANGPFEVLKKISDNAYKIDLPGEYGVSSTFNVADLKPYYDDDKFENLRANSLQQGEDDAPMEAHDEGQSQEMPKLKEVQEVLKIMRNQLKDQGSYFSVIPSKRLTFLTLVS